MRDVKLTEAQMSTLREMAGYRACYWFRQATCRTLVELGYATRVKPTLKRSPHEITPAGRAVIEKDLRNV